MEAGTRWPIQAHCILYVVNMYNCEYLSANTCIQECTLSSARRCRIYSDNATSVYIDTDAYMYLAIAVHIIYVHDSLHAHIIPM